MSFFYKSLFAMSLVCISLNTHAAKFSENNGGTLANFSVIDSTGAGDYLTLKDASLDFSGYAGGATANYTFYIATNLTEPSNLAFTNATNGFTITIKPSVGVSPTVTFSQVSDLAVSGHIVIGSLNAAFTMADTHNFVIDGSNTVNGTSRNLTLTQANPGTTSDFTNTRFIHVVGNSDNVICKNVVMLGKATTGSSSYGVFFTSRDTAAPDNWTVKNCSITMLTGGAMQGIANGASGTGVGPQKNCVIEDNFLNARTRGIFLQHSAWSAIRRNQIQVTQSSNGVLSHGIYINSAGTATSSTADIVSNRIDKLSTANSTAGTFGIRGISIEVSSAGGANTYYNIINNMICGYAFTTTAAAAEQVYQGIFLGSSSIINANIFNNSVYMPNSTKVSGVTNGNVGALIITNTAASNVVLKNNILHNDQAGANSMKINKVANINLVSDYNNLAGSCPVTGRGGATYYNTFADWQNGGFDSHGQSLSPVSGGTTPGVWTSATDLHFNGHPGGLKSGEPQALVPTDIDGETRSATLPYLGADERGTPLPVTLSRFTIE